jgi:hypothetical protein
MRWPARGRHRLYGQKITLSQTLERVVAVTTCCAVHPTLCVGQAPANMQQFPLPPSDAFPEVLLRCKAHVHNWVDNSKQRKLFSALKNSGALRMRFKADILFMASLSMVFVHLWPRLKSLFVLKWIGLAPAAAQAFAKEFLDGKHSKWSHVYVPAGIANDTNATESHNHQIKAGGTGWQLQPLPTFFERIVTFTQSKSAALAVYHHFPKIDKKTMEKAVTVMSGVWLMDDCYFNGETNFASPLNEWNTRVDDEPRRDAVIAANDAVLARLRRVAEGAGDIDVGVVVGLGVVAVVELAELQERLGDDVRFDVFEAPAEVLAAQIFERRIGCDVALADFELTRNCCT